MPAQSLSLLSLVFILIRVFHSNGVDVVTIEGAGGTFPTVVYKSWNFLYPTVNIPRSLLVNMSYSSVGSGVGLLNFTQGVADYAGSDANMTMNEQEQANFELRMIPMLAGTIAVVYQLPGYNEDVYLSEDIVVGIFNGTITRWLDQRITQLNPLLTSQYKGLNPNISVIVREDKSGSTNIFTSALSQISPTWNTAWGSFDNYGSWPKGLKINKTGQGNSGLCTEVMRTDFSIGYAELETASLFNLSNAVIINQNGMRTYADSISSLVSAVNDFSQAYISTRSNGEFATNVIMNASSANSYPLVGFTYLVLQIFHPNNCIQAYELLRYIIWCLTDPQASEVALSNNFATMPNSILPYIYSVLDQYRCLDGTNIFQRALADIKAEKNGTYIENFYYAIFVMIAVVGLFLCCVVIQAIVNWRNAINVREGNTAIRTKASFDILEAYQSFIVNKKGSTLEQSIWFFISMLQEVGLAVSNWMSFIDYPSNSPFQIALGCMAGFHSFFIILGLISKGVHIHKTFKASKPTPGSDPNISSSPLNSENKSIRKSVMGSDGDNLASVEIGSLQNALVELRQFLHGEFLCILSLGLAELPLSCLLFSTFFLYPHAAYVLKLCFCFNLYSVGYKLASMARFLNAFDLYTKGSLFMKQMSRFSEPTLLKK